MTDIKAVHDLILLATSVLAIVISSITLGWTIYRDAIKKPTFKVSVARKTIMQRGRPNDGPHLFVEALNVGPIPNRAGVTFVRRNWLKRKWHRDGGAFVYPDFQHWATTPAMTKLEVGDQATFVFPYTADCFLGKDFVQVGVADGFGRVHWCKRKEFKEAARKFRDDFPEQEASAHG